MAENLVLKWDEEFRPVIEKPHADVAEMEQNVLSGIEGISIAGVPVGQAAMGGTLAMLASELIGGLVKEGGFKAAVVKIAAGSLLVGMLSKMVGTQAARLGATFLAFDALRDVLPLDQWIRELLGGLNKQTTSVTSQQEVDQEAIQATITDLESWLAKQ